MIVRNLDNPTVAELMSDRRSIAAVFSDMLGRVATVDDLNRQLLAELREHLELIGYRRATGADYLMRVRRAWRSAYERGLTTLNPGPKHTWLVRKPGAAEPRRSTARQRIVRPMPAPAELLLLSKGMRVRDYLLHFFDQHYRGDSRDTRKAYSNAVAFFDASLGRDSSVADFDREGVNALATLETELTHKTQRGYIWRLRTVWRAAHKDKLVDTLPLDPRRRPKEPKNSSLPKSIRRRIAPVPQKIQRQPVNLAERPATPREFIAHHAANNGLVPRSERGLHYRLNQFERALARPMKWADFTDATFNTVIATELARGVTPNTVRGMRAAMRSLWNSAWWAEILDRPPGRIRKIKLKASLPQCWTSEEMARLAAQIELLTGNLRSCPQVSRKAFWKALTATAFYSGLRHGDLDGLKWENLRGDTLCVVMSKTGDMLLARLPDDCLKLLEPLREVGTAYVFSDLLSRKEQDEVFRRLVRAAGLPGSFKWLRRSAASHLERVAPGSAKGFLGHRTPDLAWKHYLDPAVVQQDRPIPPRLGILEN